MIIGTPISITGTAAAAPELKFVGQGGNAVASFSVAVNTKKGEEEITSWFRITAWGTLAENAAATIEKGTRVVVVGTVEVRNWEKDGAKGTSVDVTAESLGPDLRWASAVVTKTEKSSGGGENKGSGRQQTRPVYEDEEPF